MEDLRDTAYAYYNAGEEHLKEPVTLFFEEMDPDGDDKVRFKEFNSYMKTVDCAQFGTKDFFDLLRGDKKESYLKYCDVVTLLYIIHSGRPFCEKCKRFIQGTYFTCVQCFEAEGDYSFNFCPSCFDSFSDGSYHHCHKEFMDPFVLLRLKKKQDHCKESTLGHTKAQQMASDPGFSLSQTAETEPSTLKAIVAAPNPQHKTPIEGISSSLAVETEPSSPKAIVAAPNSPRKTVLPSASNLGISSSQTDEIKPNSSKTIVAAPNPLHKTPSASNLGISSSQTAETESSSSKAIVVAPSPPCKIVQPSASNPGISSSQTVETEPSRSKAIVAAPNPQRKKVKPDKVLQLLQLAVATGNLLVASQLCTIM